MCRPRPARPPPCPGLACPLPGSRARRQGEAAHAVPITVYCFLNSGRTAGRPVQLEISAPRRGEGRGLGRGAAPVPGRGRGPRGRRAEGRRARPPGAAAGGGGPGRPHRTRWKVSQYMSRGCAAATAMVRYMRSWFLAPRTGTPSAAASARIFSRSVRIWGGRGFTLSRRPGRGAWVYFQALPLFLHGGGWAQVSARGELGFPPNLQTDGEDFLLPKPCEKT